MKNEPILVLVAGLANIVQVALALLVAFGLSLTSAQTGAVMAATTVIVNTILAMFARQQVTPVAAAPVWDGKV